MKRTQIQLPDHLHSNALTVCEEQEISLSELARRGLEYMVSVYSKKNGINKQWAIPTSDDFDREFDPLEMDPQELKEHAQITTNELLWSE